MNSDFAYADTRVSLAEIMLDSRDGSLVVYSLSVFMPLIIVLRERRSSRNDSISVLKAPRSIENEILSLNSKFRPCIRGFAASSAFKSSFDACDFN